MRKIHFLILLVLFWGTNARTLEKSNKKFRDVSPESLARAKAVLDQHPVIDGHNDFPLALRELLKNDLRGFDFTVNLTEVEPFASYPLGSTDLVRMKEGRLGGQFWSSYITCNSQYKDAVQLFLEQVDVIKRLVEDNKSNMTFVTTANGIEQAFADGKVASLIGVESGHAINSNMALLRTLYELGTRYMTLTHSCNTPWADASEVEASNNPLPVRSNGLSDFGVKLIQEMNRLGMFIDLAHVSTAVMMDALDVSTAPLIFSHSSARTVYYHQRNVPDEVLFRMPSNGGVVMVNFFSCYLAPACNADVYDIVAHINHIRNTAGVDHVGIGSDFNGVTITPDGVEDVSKYPYLFAALIESTDVTWTDEDLAKLASGNLIRAMKGMEAERDRLATLGVDIQQDWMEITDFDLPTEVQCMTLDEID